MNDDEKVLVAAAQLVSELIEAGHEGAAAVRSVLRRYGVTKEREGEALAANKARADRGRRARAEALRRRAEELENAAD